MRTKACIEAQKRYYEKHKEKILDKRKEYYEKNSEERKEYQKEYKLEHIDEVRERDKKYSKEKYKIRIKKFQDYIKKLIEDDAERF